MALLSGQDEEREVLQAADGKVAAAQCDQAREVHAGRTRQRKGHAREPQGLRAQWAMASFPAN